MFESKSISCLRIHQDIYNSLIDNQYRIHVNVGEDNSNLQQIVKQADEWLNRCSLHYINEMTDNDHFITEHTWTHMEHKDEWDALSIIVIWALLDRLYCLILVS